MSDYDTGPLAGQRILVTRTREQASVLSQQLQSLGAEAVEFPTIRIVPPDDWSRLDAAFQRLMVDRNVASASDVNGFHGSGYDWLVFTSANGVTISFQRLLALGYDPHTIQSRCRTRIATIGPATARALEEYGVTSDLIPDEYIAEGVATALISEASQRQGSIAGQRILLARAAEARKVLVTTLQEAGAFVDEVAAYYTLPVTREDSHGQLILSQLLHQQLAYLTFTSSSTVRNFVSWLKSCENEQYPHLTQILPQLTKIACIGPVTSQTARELGLFVDIEASEFTIDGLVRAIVQHKVQHTEV